MHTAAVAACEAGADKPHDKMKASMSSVVTRLVAGAMCCVSFALFATSLESLNSRLSIFSPAVMILSGFVVVAPQH